MTSTSPAGTVPARKGTTMIIIGSVLMLPVALLVFTAVLVLSLGDIPARGAYWSAASGQSVHLPAHSSMRVRGDSVDLREGATAPTRGACTVSGPGGTVPFSPERRTSASIATTSGSGDHGRIDDESWTLGRFTTAAEGDYRISCEPYERVDVSSPSQAWEIFKDAGLGLVLALLAGSLPGVIGLGLLIAGVLQRLRTGKAAREAEARQASAATSP